MTPEQQQPPQTPADPAATPTPGLDTERPVDVVEQGGTHPIGGVLGAIAGGAAGAVIGIAAGPVGSLAGAAAGVAAGAALGAGGRQTSAPPDADEGEVAKKNRPDETAPS